MQTNSQCVSKVCFGRCCQFVSVDLAQNLVAFRPGHLGACIVRHNIRPWPGSGPAGTATGCLVEESLPWTTIVTRRANREKYMRGLAGGIAAATTKTCSHCRTRRPRWRPLHNKHRRPRNRVSFGRLSRRYSTPVAQMVARADDLWSHRPGIRRPYREETPRGRPPGPAGSRRRNGRPVRARVRPVPRR